LCAQCLALTSPALTHLQEATRGAKKQRSKKGDPSLGEQVSILKTEKAALNQAIDNGKTAVRQNLMELMTRLQTDNVDIDTQLLVINFFKVQESIVAPFNNSVTDDITRYSNEIFEEHLDEAFEVKKDEPVVQASPSYSPLPSPEPEGEDGVDGDDSVPVQVQAAAVASQSDSHGEDGFAPEAGGEFPNGPATPEASQEGSRAGQATSTQLSDGVASTTTHANGVPGHVATHGRAHGVDID